MDYFDEVEAAERKISHHRVLLSYEYQSSKDFEENKRPGNFEQNFDLSEKGSL